MNRKERLQQKINKNIQKATDLMNKNIDLEFEIKKLKGKGIRFESGVEWLDRKKTKSALILKRFWKEEFKDEESGKFIFIERVEWIAIDGVPCDYFKNPVKRYVV